MKNMMNFIVIRGILIVMSGFKEKAYEGKNR